MLGGWQPAQYVADVGDEPQIKHPVRFVQHRTAYEAQVEHMLLVVVDDATWRADQHIDAFLELTSLFFIVHTTEHHRDA